MKKINELVSVVGCKWQKIIRVGSFGGDMRKKAEVGLFFSDANYFYSFLFVLLQDLNSTCLLLDSLSAHRLVYILIRFVTLPVQCDVTGVE